MRSVVSKFLSPSAWIKLFGRKSTPQYFALAICLYTILSTSKVVHHKSYPPHQSRDEGGCTIIMPTCFRTEAFDALLMHYSKLNKYIPTQIIVVHQPCSDGLLHPPAELNGVEIVYKRMERNDMNNRYINFPEIRHSCLINVDDDILHPIGSIVELFSIWNSHFRNYYVGWEEQGRLHTFRNGEYHYNLGKTRRIYRGLSSILIPSGSIYHRRFTDLYNLDSVRRARDVVRELSNCDDILLNFVIANASQNGPVLVRNAHAVYRDTYFESMSRDPKTAQWQGRSHVDKRSACIQAFAAVFNGVPLRYTSTIVEVVSGESSAVLHKYDPPMTVVQVTNASHLSSNDIKSSSSYCEMRHVMEQLSGRKNSDIFSHCRP